MLIRVKYDEKRYDMVKEAFLERLIESCDIEGFYRSGGWVTVGCDPVRTKPGRNYGAAERRSLAA